MELQDVLKQLDDLKGHCEDMARDKDCCGEWKRDAEALREAIRILTIYKNDRDEIERLITGGKSDANQPEPKGMMAEEMPCPHQIQLLMNHDILRNAIEKWGYNSQLNKAQEECAELVMAICKHDTANIIEECADVLIMCEQIKMMFGAEKVEEMIGYKLKRLEMRLK